jgi:hypothetical protein
MLVFGAVSPTRDSASALHRPRCIESSSATLVLLNGRRMTPVAYADPNDGNSTLYDLNAIPLAALERVEILRDGATAEAPLAGDNEGLHNPYGRYFTASARYSFQACNDDPCPAWPGG